MILVPLEKAWETFLHGLEGFTGDFMSEGRDKLPITKNNRSEFIETALWDFVERAARIEQNAKDLKILNQRADALNRETSDVLEYQAE